MRIQVIVAAYRVDEVERGEGERKRSREERKGF